MRTTIYCPPFIAWR